MSERTDLKDLKETYGLTNKLISITWDIPERTLENWDYRKSCPCYVELLLKTYYETEYKRIVEEQLEINTSKVIHRKQIGKIEEDNMNIWINIHNKKTV